MNKILLFALAALGALVAPASAQQASSAFIVATCGTLPAGVVYAAGQFGIITMDTTGQLCDGSSGGGGGGLSVTDRTTWIQGTSAFTPTGGVFNDTATLSSGQEGTLRLTTKRAAIMDVDTAGNALYAAVTAAGPCLNATAFNTNSYLTGGTNPTNCDLNGNLYTNGGTNRWAGTALGAPSNYGTSPGAVAVPGVNAFVTNKVLVTPDSVALPANQSVNTSQVNGVTVLTGTGATGTGAQRVTVSTDQATNAGAALVKGGVGVVNGGSIGNTIAASQTAQVMSATQGGGTGATGDYISHCLIQPTTTAAGTVTVLDNATVMYTFTTGTLSNLATIPVPLGMVSVSGAWKVTTGANEIVTCVGKFS